MGGAPTGVEQPPSIRNAVRLMYVGAVLSVLGALSIFLQVDAIRDQIEEDDPSLSGDDVDTAVAIFVVTFVVVSLISVGLWLWMAYANGAGKSWARVVATVLGGLNIVRPGRPRPGQAGSASPSAGRPGAGRLHPLAAVAARVDRVLRGHVGR